MTESKSHLLAVPVLTVALTAAATFLSTQTYVRPDVGSVSFGFPLSWLSIAHGFIRAPPVWTVDWFGLAGDLAAWFAVSVVAAYGLLRLRERGRSARLNTTGIRVAA